METKLAMGALLLSVMNFKTFQNGPIRTFRKTRLQVLFKFYSDLFSGLLKPPKSAKVKFKTGLGSINAAQTCFELDFFGLGRFEQIVTSMLPKPV